MKGGRAKPEQRRAESHAMPECLCPACGYAVDHVSTTEKGRKTMPPVKGDFTMCVACGEICRFDAFLSLAPCSEAELTAFAFEQPNEYATFRRAQHFVRRQKDWIPVAQRGGRG